MKKIIELAEQLSNLAVGGNYVTMLVTQKKLNKTLAERKELEQTPITEEWLKEHGWSKGLPYDDWWYMNDSFCLFREDNDAWNICDTNMKLKSLADLYDACELCGIELD